MLDRKTEQKLLDAQKSEITEHFIYEKLSRAMKDRHNREVVQRIARDELAHYNVWKQYTHRDLRPNRLKLWLYYLVSRILGITFGIKLMEEGEEQAEANYREIAQFVPAAQAIAKEEDEHEKELIGLIDEERLKYTGAMVRGLNDALVELTGALAGFTFALQNTRLIAVVGLITGIAASLSMAGSEYLATKSEEGAQTPKKAAVYTGLAYILTVIFLIFPYFLFSNVYFSLGLMLFDAIVVILVFNYYIACLLYTSDAADE